MRQLVAQNPAMTQALIQQIAATNPGLLHQLGGNPEQVIQQILESANEDGGEGDEEGPFPPGTHVLSVTAEERAAIERVRRLCCPQKSLVLQISFDDSWKP
jgi:UV excision repair protein RAD23